MNSERSMEIILPRVPGESAPVFWALPCNDAATALCCARALSHSLECWNRDRSAAGLPAIRVGIGLHYGPAVAGDIGSEHNMAYAVIGSTVNLTSRLEGLTQRQSVFWRGSDGHVAALSGARQDRWASIGEGASTRCQVSAWRTRRWHCPQGQRHTGPAVR